MWVRFLGQEDSPREGHGVPLQYSCQENAMARGTWWATVHGVAQSSVLVSLIKGKEIFLSNEQLDSYLLIVCD